MIMVFSLGKETFSHRREALSWGCGFVLLASVRIPLYFAPIIQALAVLRSRADLLEPPLPICTDPYLLAIYSDGPLRSQPVYTDRGIEYNSFRSLELIGDSLSLHYLRTHWWQSYGSSLSQSVIPHKLLSRVCLSIPPFVSRVIPRFALPSSRLSFAHPKAAKTTT